MESVTRESVRPLLDLQRIDSSLDRLAQRKADLPEQRELDALAAERAGLAVTHGERQGELDAVVREQSKLEDEISSITSKIEHEQARLYSGQVQNPKELSNIQAELDALRRRKSHLEDQELEVMEKREAIEGDAGALTTQLGELDARIAAAAAARDSASVEIENELSSLGAERAQIVPSLPAEVIEVYEEARVKRGGVAVGALQNGMCTACRLPLSPLARDEIRRSDNPLPRCENCRRILVVV
ncbi:MAG: zinc ribbon domain-containing protein [Actinomycetota bacterium]